MLKEPRKLPLSDFIPTRKEPVKIPLKSITQDNSKKLEHENSKAGDKEGLCELESESSN